MLETTLPTLTRWMSRWGKPWRLSTWWPSDSRTAMQRSLLHLLAVAHRERLELAPLVGNLAEEHRGAYRRRLRQLAKRLRQGTPLVDALEQTPDVLRDDAVLAIRFAHQTGTLGPIYRQLINSRDPASSNQINAAIRQAVLYGAITALVTAWSLTFLFTFIMPTLKLIQADAFTDLPQQPQPWALSTFDALGTLVLQHAPLWILAAVVLAWLILAPPSRRYLRRVLASRWIRGVAEVRTAEVLQLLATSVEQGRPVPAALSTLAQYHFDASVRHKLMAARIEAEHRDDVWKVLSDVHLLTAEESAAIAVASTEPSRVWTMRQLADAMLQRAAQRGETLVSLLQPMIVLPLASLVLLTCCAMIGFLVHLTGQSLP